MLLLERSKTLSTFAAMGAMALLSSCGVVNGLGGPWPLIGTAGDGGPIVVQSDGGTCPAETHNGGNGDCVAEGECSRSFFLEASGRCARWSVVAALTPARSLHTLTPLADGRALAVGGLAGVAPIGEGPAHLYDAGLDRWLATSSSVRSRYRHTATLLGGNRVVIAGGLSDDGTPEPVAELFRADQDRWVDLGELTYGRTAHQAAAMGGGIFVVLGGRGPTGAVLSTVEQLDGGDFVVISASMNVARADFTAVRLNDNEILILGGRDGGGAPLISVEHYVMGEGSFTTKNPMLDARSDHTATLLSDGRVVVIGGRTDAGAELEALRTVEVYDLANDRWEDFSPLAVPRWGHSATTLDDGRILIAGGFSAGDIPTASVEILDPEIGSMSEGPLLSNARGNAPAALLADDSLLIAQGSFDAATAAAVTSVERYTFGADAVD